MQNVDLKAVLADVRPGGCVQPYLAGFAAELVSAGYTLLSARDYMRSAAHLGRWLSSRNRESTGSTRRPSPVSRTTSARVQA